MQQASLSKSARLYCKCFVFGFGEIPEAQWGNGNWSWALILNTHTGVGTGRGALKALARCLSSILCVCVCVCFAGPLALGSDLKRPIALNICSTMTTVIDPKLQTGPESICLRVCTSTHKKDMPC